MASHDRRPGRRRLAAAVLRPGRGGRGSLRLGRGFAIAFVLLAATAAAAMPGTPRPQLEQLVGARLVVAIGGTSPAPGLRERIRRGRVGGVILMGWNIRSAPQVRRLTADLRAAAREGGRRILIVTDQEGGAIRRLRWAPPAASAQELGRLGEATLRRRGRDTARALDRLGVDVDLAPVADVPSVRDSFVSAQQRAFSRIPNRVGKAVTAFSAGLLDGGVVPTLKHFPGLGLATASTDRAAVTIDASAATLEPGLIPYRRAIAAGVVPLVMVSNAAYTAYGGRPAAWSPRVLERLAELGYAGATITDALEAVATTWSVPLDEAAFRAARAGVDLLLFVGSESSTQRVYDRLLAEARAGRLSRESLERSAARIEELATTYAG